MINYGLYLATNDIVIRFPVNPEEYSIEYPEDNETYNILGIGEVVQPRLPGLASVSWESFFPGTPNAPYVLTPGDFWRPEQYINFLNQCKKDRSVLLFTANRYLEDGTALFDTKMKVVISDFEVTEKGGETGDFYYEIELKEYRDYQAGTVTFTNDTGSESAEAVTEEQREIDPGQIVVGSNVLINGKYWASSYGDAPFGRASNKQGIVSRIITTDPNRAYPIHVTNTSGGALGWVRSDQLKTTG